MDSNKSGRTPNRSGKIIDVDFSKAYLTLSLFRTGPQNRQNTDLVGNAYSARFSVDGDLSPLFPYINAVAKSSQYYERPVYIKFLLHDRLCALYPDSGAFAPVEDYSEAVSFLTQLSDFFEDINRRKDQIQPNYKKYKPVSPVDIYKLLPSTNCKICGHPTCIAFAAALSRQKASLIDCPHLANPVEAKATFPIFDEQGNCIETVSLDIDTDCLRQAMDKKNTRIQTLQSQLADFESTRVANIDEANASLPTPLTRREFQVLQMVASGDTNKEISKSLNISEHTVKSHVIHIFNKLGVNDRTQASVWAASRGLL